MSAGGGNLKTFVTCYWFLKSAFICSILYFAADKCGNKIAGYGLTLIASVFISIYTVNLMYPMFIIGALLYKRKEGLRRHSMPICVISFIIYVAMFCGWNAEMAAMKVLKLYTYIRPGGLSDLSYPFYCYAYKVIMGISGSLTVMSLFIELSKRMSVNRPGTILGEWGTMTLGIYLLQAIVLEHWMMKTIDLSGLSYLIFNYVASPLLSAGVLMVCVVITKVLKRDRWVSFLFLGAPRPEKTEAKAA